LFANTPAGGVAVNVVPDACGPTVADPICEPPVVHHSNVADTGDPSGSVTCACNLGRVVFRYGRPLPDVHWLDGVVACPPVRGGPLNVIDTYGGWSPSDELNRFHPLWFVSLVAFNPVVHVEADASAACWKDGVSPADTHPAAHDDE
jgi:hypothetical protein